MLPTLMTGGNQTKSRLYHIHGLHLLSKQLTSCLLLSTTENQAKVVILKSILVLCSKWLKCCGDHESNHANISSWFSVWLSGLCQHPAK